jgi:hypothetical protein
LLQIRLRTFRIISQSFNVKQLTKELKIQNLLLSSRLDAKTIGYLKINRAQTELMDEHAIEIHRIYVLEEYQGKKSRANI